MAFHAVTEGRSYQPKHLGNDCGHPTSTSARARGLVAVGVVVVVAAVLVGWAGLRGGEDSAGNATSSTARGATIESETTAAPVAEPNQVAEALVDPIEIFAQPAGTSPERVLRASDAVTVPSVTPIVFLVKEESAVEGWLEVYLPVRPNGSTGFVRAIDVGVTEHPFRVEVDLTNRVLRAYEGDELRTEHAVGVGRNDRPTPGGVYYIKELLRPPDPNGVYGTYAFGLSGFSNVLETFAGGEAVIGIHGTNDPSSIGREVSSGCIRLPNDVINELVTYIPLGTPVQILG